MHQALKRLNPSDNHVYGQFTQHLQQQQPGPGAQQNGGSGLNLPPINPPGSRHEGSSFGPSGPGAAMQGVEYGNYGLAR